MGELCSHLALTVRAVRVLTGVFAVRVSYTHILTFWAFRLRDSNIQAKFKVVKIDLAVDMLAP